MWTFRTIILPIAIADIARNLCMALTGSASEGMFTTPLYTSSAKSGTAGDAPTHSIADATHTISSGYIATEFAEVLPCGGEGGDVETLVGLLSSVGAEVPLEQLEQLLSMIDISEEEPHVALDRLGLSMSDGLHEGIDEPSALPD